MAGLLAKEMSHQPKCKPRIANDETFGRGTRSAAPSKQTRKCYKGGDSWREPKAVTRPNN
jgi:hypothetical protein